MVYLEGDLVWIPHSSFGYCKSKVLRNENQHLYVQVLENNEELKISISNINPYNQEDDKNYEDMINIQDLTEATLLYNLKQRYKSDDIYTYIGNVLVSINPFKNLNIYNNEMIDKYKDISQIATSQPHIFAVASRAYHSMISERKNQSIIISGESGSGKTEATKSCIQFLVQVSSGKTTASTTMDNQSNVERDILASNPILEAFGNSRTTKNYNSSRFGKFLKIEFRQSDWRIIGASVETYLLEKSRISHRPDRLNLNYHIFYYLVWGCSQEERAQWNISGDPKKYRYLDANDDILDSYKKISMNPKDLSESFRLVKSSMLAMGISSEDSQSIFKILSAILLLGNIEFSKDPNGFADLSKKPGVQESLNSVSALLGIPPGLFKQSLLNRNLKASGRGSIYTKPMEVDQSEQARDALSKSLYFKLFQTIVDRINKKFIHNNSKINNNGNEKSLFIGVLDIFGFECLSLNSLDQLLINVTNERIQQQFNHTVFESEQKEYISEGIPWSNTSFIDNKECIDLIEKKQYGLLSLLDDECLMPKGSESTLLEKFNSKYLNNNHHYIRSLAKGTFTIKHFAGEVNYQMDGWLEKNRDNLLLDLEDLLLNSLNDLIKLIFSTPTTSNGNNAPLSRNNSNNVLKQPPQAINRERLNSTNSSGSFGASTGTKKATNQSVSSQFIEQLNRLISTVNSTTVHYIRCIKPNVTLDSDNFNNIHVLSQLRNVGLLQTVQIRKMGYSYRKDIKSFLNRYLNLLHNSSKTNAKKNNDIQNCKLLLEQIHNNYLQHQQQKQQQQKKQLITTTGTKLNFQIGKSKVFLTDELYIYFEEKRYEKIITAVRVIQCFFKMLKLRKTFKQQSRSALVLQTSIRSHLKRKEIHNLLLLDRQKKEEEKKKELERKRKEEEEKLKEEERKRKEEEKLRKDEEERLRKEQDKQRKEEEDKLKKEQEKLKKEQDKQRKEEEDKLKKEQEKLKKEEKKKLNNNNNSTTNSTTSTTTATTTPTIGIGASVFSNLFATFSGNSSSSTTTTTTTSPSTNQSSISSKSIFISSDVYGTEKREAQLSKPLPNAPLKSNPIAIAMKSKWNITSSPSNRSPRFLGGGNKKVNTPVDSPILIGRKQPLSFVQSSHSAPTSTIPNMILSPTSNSIRVSDEPSLLRNKDNNNNNNNHHHQDDNSSISSSPNSISHSISNESIDIGTSPPISSPPISSPPISSPPISSSPISSSSPLSFSSSNNLTPTELIEKHRRLRTEILKEIIVTEKDYIRDISIVLEIFLVPIREKSLLSTKEINTLFSNIEILHSVSKTMLEELIGNDDDPTYENARIGQAFLKMSDYLKMYNVYCSNQQQALKLLEEEKVKNQGFKEYLELCMADARCRGLPLISFIIKPVQRICKYPLLLKEVLKYTPETHLERQPLEEADKKISDIVAAINEGKRLVEMFQKILDLQSSIDGINDNLMEPGRQLLMETSVTSVKELSSEDHSLQRTLLLFNNLIILCSPISVMASAINNFKSKKYQYKLKASIPIPLARIMYVSDTDAVKYAIELWNTKEESNYILCFNSENQRMLWFKQIKNLIQDYKLSSNGRPLLGSRK